MSSLNLFVEGQFLDSYIYSGNLFLLDENYVLSIYKWDQLVDVATKRNTSEGLESLLKDSSQQFSLNINEIVITPEELKTALSSRLDLGVWPSDINVFANILYVSSENGVIRYNLDYKKGVLGSEFLIFDEVSFSISPNSSNRVAIAAGKSGVLTFVPKSRHLSRKYLKEFTLESCTDVDWQSTTLLANTVFGVKRADFIPMPVYSDFYDKNDFYARFKEFKEFTPKLHSKEHSEYSWIGGNKLFSLNHDQTITVEDLNKKSIIKSVNANIKNKVIKVKSSSFGAILETEDSLYIVRDEEPQKVYGEPVNWRVFPRAKFYSNHLHIISDNHIEIRIISSSDNDTLGFNPDEIDLNG
ncbi:TPA: hypothetical protein GRR69_05295 [Vibrio parahaemolyticus]|uniref:hypothetical protein n=1 Tax=Vibrio parahaemolyticus TaxID=670 RepID=UPI001A239519|nr:hypothetical protein [Vibrio parahaemolyticus]MDQ2215204.1 hypothetical protein [Vibrio parahaemolyticus]HAS6482024.1 hypothetical protein [Vibrio parahaemolyticus]